MIKLLKGFAPVLLTSILLTSCGEEPGVYSMTPAQLRAELESATISYKPNPTGPTQTISGNGIVNESVRLSLSSSNGGEYSRSCLLNFSAVDDSNTKVQAECNRGAGSSSQSRTMEQLDEASVMEFVDAHLSGRPFNYGAVALKQAGVMHENLDANTKEALENYDRAQAGVYETDEDAEAMMSEAANQTEMEDAGWGAE